MPAGEKAGVYEFGRISRLSQHIDDVHAVRSRFVELAAGSDSLLLAQALDRLSLAERSAKEARRRAAQEEGSEVTAGVSSPGGLQDAWPGAEALDGPAADVNSEGADGGMLHALEQVRALAKDLKVWAREAEDSRSAEHARHAAIYLRAVERPVRLHIKRLGSAR